MLTTEIYVAGSEKNKAYELLNGIILPDDRFLRMRLYGELADVSNDLFFLTHDEKKGLSRIWMGYGKHDNSVCNWGAVYTPEEHRGNGYCTNGLKYCFEYIDNMDEAPLALFCTAGTLELTNLYKKYGWTTAIKGRDKGPLYRPLGDSPESFQEFCKEYYTESDELYVIDATFEWRNEIDCLLRFALIDSGEAFGIKGNNDMWPILMNEPERVKIILTKENKCVGWMLDGESQLYPLYRNITKITKL